MPIWAEKIAEYIVPVLLGGAIHYMNSIGERLEEVGQKVAILNVMVSELRSEVNHLEGLSGR